MAVYNLDKYTSGDGFGMPLNIRRGNPNPLDNTEMWASVTEAMNYAKTDPTAYVGQIISWKTKDGDGNDTVKAAQIINEDGDLIMLSSGSSEGSSIELDEITERGVDDIIFSVFG